jgi:type II secretory pathway pseudopilin PulG
LIELLVVIGIITLLAGLLLPAVMKTIDFARRTNAREDVMELEAAWLAYLADYRSFPDLAISQMDPQAVHILTTNKYYKGTEVVNFLQEQYMDFTRLQRQWGMFDYWAETAVRKGADKSSQTSRVYQVALDNGYLPHDTTGPYDGQVTPYAPNDMTIVTKSVAVWSRGEDGLDDTPETRKDDVRNW